MDFPGKASGKEPAYQCRTYKRLGLSPWVGKIPWRRAWQPTPLFLPGESHGQRSLIGYCPWGHRVEHDWRDLAHMHVPLADSEIEQEKSERGANFLVEL